MATNLPQYFIEEVRLEIIDSTSYSDNEICEFARRGILEYTPAIRENIDITNGASVWDYTVNGVDQTDAWEVFKWATIVKICDHYYKNSIADGVGVSVSIGAERYDSKTILNTLKSELKDARKKLNGKILQYNMRHRSGAIVDLYSSDSID